MPRRETGSAGFIRRRGKEGLRVNKEGMPILLVKKQAPEAKENKGKKVLSTRGRPTKRRVCGGNRGAFSWAVSPLLAKCSRRIGRKKRIEEGGGP